MMPLSYKKEIEYLKENMPKVRSENGEGPTVVEDAKVSASLYNLMPEIEIEKHDEVIRNMAFFRKWAVKDQHHAEISKNMISDGVEPDFDHLRENPTIFCSYHIGSYRMLLPFLLSRNIKISLLIAGDVAKSQSEDFYQVIERARGLYPLSKDCFRIFDTSGGNIVLKMMRELKEGRSLFIFIDGNQGVDGRSSNKEKLAPVRFFNHILHSRKGVGYLSHLCNASITPLVTYRNPENIWENRVRYFSPIAPLELEEREEYVDRALQRLYTILEDTLPSVLEQWESWRYVEKSLEAAASSTEKTIPISLDAISKYTLLRFNVKRYKLFRIDDFQFVLFDRSSYRSIFISRDFMNFLQTFIEAPKTIESIASHPNISENSLTIFIAKGILEICV